MRIINVFLFELVSILYLLNIDTLNSLFTDRKNNSKAMIPIVAVYFIMAAVYAIFTNSTHILLGFISVILFYSLPFIISMLRYKAHKLQGLYIAFTFLIVDSIIQSVVDMLLRFMEKNFDLHYVNNLTSLIFNVAVFFSLRYCYSKHKERIRSAAALPKRSFYILMLITLMIIASLSANMSIDIINIPVQNRINTAFTILTIFITLIIIVVLFIGSVSKQYFENNLKMLEKQMTLQIEHYEKLGKLNDEIKSFRHDYKNHMRALQSILEKGTSEEALEYVKDITNQEIIESDRFSTGNQIADSILDDKNNDAAKVGCTINFFGYISDEISPVDICTILSNALDNAVEACGRISSDEVLTIKVKCAVEQGIQIISITNPNYDDSSDLSTSKTDKSSHGFGLFNIRRTVEKLDGEISISQRTPNFVLDIEFPIHTM